MEDSSLQEPVLDSRPDHVAQYHLVCNVFCYTSTGLCFVVTGVSTTWYRYIVTHTSIDWVLITLIVLIITKKLKKRMCHIHIF